MASTMMSIREVAELFGCGRTLVNRLLSEGELTSYKIGGIRRIPAAAVREYLDSVASRP